MTDFNQNSDAYKVIGSLSKLRKNNLALAYGTTEQKWINNDVIIYERKFGSNVVLTAVNKGSQNYHISGLYTSLPSGSYDSVLSFLTRNTKINVDGQGKVADFWLKANEVNVWEFQSHDNELEIGDVDPSIGITGNVLTISGTGFGNQVGQVLFDDKSAEIIEWNDEVIKLKVAQTTPGLHDVIVKTNAGKTVVYPNFEVLTDSQIPYRIFGENIKTTWNENVYVVGNVEELGNWDVNKAVGPMFNATQSIAQYPNWFIDLNLPKNRAIEYKLIKKDSSGKVIWESGSNHKIHTSNTADSNRSSWQY
ncbi:carbohydrate-binding module family 20 domain-containing protein [Enterococcus cecorum]|nr:carbohydrate-binding module family 20 domain-containing protein [Enterococcus cecorum]